MTARRRAGGGAERGSASLLLLAVAGVLLLLATAVADAGSLITARRAAAGAADAAALAAAPVTFRPFGASGSPAAEAARYAVANGTRLVACRCRSDPSWAVRIVEVTVEGTVDLVLFGERTVTAASRARFDPGSLVAPSRPGAASPPGSQIPAQRD